MAFIVWVLIGSGGYLIWAAITNKPPITYAQSILTGKA